jgi:signal transduction histidine kinase
MRTCQAVSVHQFRADRAGAGEPAESAPRGVLAFAREHPVATDRVFTALLAAVSLAGMWLVSWSSTTHYRSPDAGGVLLTLAIVVPLAWRRQRPALVLVISGLALLAYDAIGYRSGLAWLATFWAVYSYAVYRRRRDAYWPLAVWVAVILALPALPGRGYTVPSALIFLAITAFVWLRGDAVRSGLIEANRKREARARQAVADERARIARELHDVVSQALGVIVMQAGGAGSVPRLGEADAKAVLGTIEQTGRQAFAEMRRLVGVLRDDNEAAATGPQPTVDEIPALLARLADSGLDVDLEVEGERRPVPAGVGLSAYRIVAEALTNTLKHAGGARARVRLVWSADRLGIEVTDDGPGAGLTVPARARPDSGGNGLAGMRERAMLYGGELEAGPAADGTGYRVVARLPLGGAG